MSARSAGQILAARAGVRQREGKPAPVRQPCEVCKRIHRGRCAQPEDRSVSVTFTLPRWLLRHLHATVGTGSRSAYIRQLIEKDLA